MKSLLSNSYHLECPGTVYFTDSNFFHPESQKQLNQSKQPDQGNENCQTEKQVKELQERLFLDILFCDQIINKMVFEWSFLFKFLPYLPDFCKDLFTGLSPPVRIILFQPFSKMVN